MTKKAFIRCVQCGGEWPHDQIFTQLTDSLGNFLPLDRQLELPVMVMENPARPVCYRCYSRVKHSVVKPVDTIHNCVVLPVNLDGSVSTETSRLKHSAPSSTACNLAVLPVNLVEAKPEPYQQKSKQVRQPDRLMTSSGFNVLADQLSAWETRRDQLGFLPKPGPNQVSRYLNSEQGDGRFEIVDAPKPEVERLISRDRDQRIDRTYALTGEVIPETPLGLAQTAGPITSRQDTVAVIDRYEEVALEFEGLLGVYDSDWEFHEATHPSGYRASESIRGWVDKQILSMIKDNPKHQRQFESFRDLLRSQGEQDIH